jgi:hypothetical protein
MQGARRASHRAGHGRAWRLTSAWCVSRRTASRATRCTASSRLSRLRRRRVPCARTARVYSHLTHRVPACCQASAPAQGGVAAAPVGRSAQLAVRCSLLEASHARTNAVAHAVRRRVSAGARGAGAAALAWRRPAPGSGRMGSAWRRPRGSPPSLGGAWRRVARGAAAGHGAALCARPAAVHAPAVCGTHGVRAAHTARHTLPVCILCMSQRVNSTTSASPSPSRMMPGYGPMAGMMPPPGFMQPPFYPSEGCVNKERRRVGRGVHLSCTCSSCVVCALSVALSRDGRAAPERGREDGSDEVRMVPAVHTRCTCTSHSRDDAASTCTRRSGGRRRSGGITPATRTRRRRRAGSESAARAAAAAAAASCACPRSAQPYTVLRATVVVRVCV